MDCASAEMLRSIYSPLPKDTFSIRLLQLTPSLDPLSPVHCKLIIYPLDDRPSHVHTYEALSYTWGSSDYSQTILVDSGTQSLEIQTTQNLHAALMKLRDPYFARCLWIDALCINQEDDKEKAHQVGAMARIYGLAWQVVVWLGEEDDDSSSVFQTFGTSEWIDKKVNTGATAIGLASELKGSGNTASDADSEDKDRWKMARAILALFSRKYFSRIWVLQELAAARKLLFVCGHTEISGELFRAGIVALSIEEHIQTPAPLHRVRVIVALLDYSSVDKRFKGLSHLNIQPLAELVDLFHAHEATDRRDKIYALLGMCSDHELAKALEPDYSIEWKRLFEELGRFMFGPYDFVSASNTREILYISSRGFILGRVCEVSIDGFWSDTQVLNVETLRRDRVSKSTDWWNVRCRLRRSVKKIEKDDMVILLDTSRKIIIARWTEHYLKIITITDNRLVQFQDDSVPEGRKVWHPHLEAIESCPLRMIWNWNENCENETRDAVRLMGFSSPPISECQEDEVSRANALCAMADLALNCDAYDGAMRLRGIAAFVSGNVHATGPQLTIGMSEQQIKAKRCALLYNRTLRLLHNWCKSKLHRLLNHDDATWHCCAILLDVHGLWSSSAEYSGPDQHKLAALQVAARFFWPEDADFLIAMDELKEPTSSVVLAAAQNYNFKSLNFLRISQSVIGLFERLRQIIEILSKKSYVGLDFSMTRCLQMLDGNVTRYHQGEYKIVNGMIPASTNGMMVAAMKEAIQKSVRFSTGPDTRSFKDPEAFTPSGYDSYRKEARFIKHYELSMIVLLLRHVQEEDLEELVRATGIARHAAQYGCTSILRDLRRRLKQSEEDIETLLLLAELRKSICCTSKSASTDHLIQELATCRNKHGVLDACNFTLMLAIEKSASYAVKRLLKRSLADVNFADTLGRTPLHIATYRHVKKDITRSLLEYGAGASLDCEDNHGGTPRNFLNREVRSKGNMTLWQFLLKKLPNRKSFGTISRPSMELLPPDPDMARITSTRLLESHGQHIPR